MNPEPEMRRAFNCPHCHTISEGHVRGIAISTGVTPLAAHYEPPVEWTLIQCTRCHIPSVQIREDFGRGFGDDEPTIYFPRPRRLSGTVPEALRQDWDEARVCLDAKAYRASVVMVRRVLEGVAHLHGVRKGTLEERLTKMAQKGLLDATLATWAQELRLLGNKGAHFKPELIVRQDAEDALDFAEALLDHVYVLRQRFEEFRARNRSPDGDA